MKNMKIQCECLWEKCNKDAVQFSRAREAGSTFLSRSHTAFCDQHCHSNGFIARYKEVITLEEFVISLIMES